MSTTFDDTEYEQAANDSLSPMFLDGFKNRFIENFIGGFVDWRGIQGGDVKAIEDAVHKVIKMTMPELDDEASEIFDVVREAVKTDPDPKQKALRIAREVGDAVVKFCDQRIVAKGIKVGSLFDKLEVRRDVRKMTRDEADKWWAENKSCVRTESAGFAVRKALRKLPEIQQGLEGKMDGPQLRALDPEKVVTWLNRAIMLLTLVSMFYPPALVVVTTLKLILARYESNNPDVGLSLDTLAG